MGTVNLLSAFLKEQPLYAKSHKNLIITLTFALLLLGIAKYLHELLQERQRH